MKLRRVSYSQEFHLSSDASLWHLVQWTDVRVRDGNKECLVANRTGDQRWISWDTDVTLDGAPSIMEAIQGGRDVTDQLWDKVR